MTRNNLTIVEAFLATAFLIIAGLSLFCPVAFAQDSQDSPNFPNKPIEIIVPWASGGNADQQARILARMSEDILDVPIFVKNVPGGSTIPGVMQVLSQPANGYSLIWTAIPTVATVPLLKNTPYSVDELCPLANVSKNTLVLFVRDESDWDTLEEFINAARKQKAMNVAINAIGALPHLAAVGLAQKAGLKFNYITEGSSAGAVVSLLGKHVDVAVAHEPQAFAYDGIKALAAFQGDRSKYLPDTPTADELGYKIYGYVRDSISIDCDAPASVKRTLANAFAKVIKSEELLNEFKDRQIKQKYLTPSETRDLWRDARQQYKKVITRLKSSSSE